MSSSKPTTREMFISGLGAVYKSTYQAEPLWEHDLRQCHFWCFRYQDTYVVEGILPVPGQGFADLTRVVDPTVETRKQVLEEMTTTLEEIERRRNVED